jgi:hypothetical protein
MRDEEEVGEEEEVVNWDHCWMELKMGIFTRKFQAF